MKNINWYEVQTAAFTAIRLNFPVSVLEMLAAGGSSTPVSGDALVQAKAGTR